MLKSNTTTDPTAIEKHFCEKFKALKRHPMDKDVMEIFVTVMMAHKDKRANELLQEAKKAHHTFEITEKRSQALDLKMDPAVIFFLTVVAGSPGNIVMYLTYIRYWAANENTSNDVTWDDFTMQLFPNGFPSEEDLRKLWDEYKEGKENCKPKNQ